MDIIIFNYDFNDVFVLLGNGDGIFMSVRNFIIGGFRFEDVVIKDINGDCNLDIMVNNIEFVIVVVLLGNGDGIFGLFISFLVGGRFVGVIGKDLN